MLSFDIRSLESQAAHVDGRLSPEDPVWEAGDLRPVEPLKVQGRLSAAGTSRFYFSGRIKGLTEIPCRRCLTDVTVGVDEEAHFIFSSEGEDAADDPDVYPFDPTAVSLDLRPAVREAWLLAVVLERGHNAKVSVHPTEKACVAAGEKWERETDELYRRLKKPRAPGWICTPVEETPS